MKRFFTYARAITAVLIVLLILTNSVSFSSTLALDTADNTNQIEYAGGWNPSDYPVDGTLYKDRIAVSKTIAPTEYENYFDITLKIVAKPRVIDQSVDVVVVMDVSNTMNSTHQGLGPSDAGYDIKDARLTQAKSAVDNFLDLYAEDKNLSEERRFGLVTFNSYANTVVPMTAVNSAQKAEEIKAMVDAVEAPLENRVRFTNTEAGLQLAYNLLKDSQAAFRYIILVTDGLPTTYIESGRDSLSQITGYDTYMTGSYNADLAGTDGYFADSVTEKVCTYGVTYSDKAADRADDVAEEIKDAGINIFSVGVDIDVQSVPNYLKLAENTDFTSVDRTSSVHVVGDTTETYKDWLRNSIAGGPMIEVAEKKETLHRYSQGNSLAELGDAFAGILKDIEIIPKETMEEAYTLDTLSENVEFVHFFDAEGNPADHVTNTRTGRDVAVFDDESETIRWWLRTTQSWSIDEIGNYNLYLVYRVRLKNEVKGFDASSSLATNGKTTFYFRTVDFSTGEPLFGDNSIDYPVPQVKGYAGKLCFTTVDAESGSPLKGAEFRLQHYEAGCEVCHGDAVISEVNATSDTRGKVEFKNIPSGHEYVLIETKAPEGYKSGSYHFVKVAYGNTYLDSVLVTEDEPGVIARDSIEPVEVTLSAHTDMKGREPEAEEFLFSLSGTFEFGNRFHEVAPCDENGNVTFHEMRFDKEGTYNFRMYQEITGDTSVIYDTKVYDVQIQVGLSADRKAYTVTTTVDGEPVENDITPAPFEFTNTLREAGSAQFEIEKTLDGKAPQDGLFTFILKDAKGNENQTVETVDGKAVFDEIKYTEEGVYRYTISEEHNYDIFDTVFFDHSVYNVLVTVTAPDGNGRFETEIQYLLDGVNTDTPVFKNETRQEATLEVNFIKTLDGVSPAKDRFTFELRDVQGEVVAVVKNSQEGVVSLGELIFDEVGYFVYTVNEVIGDEKGIIYDKTVYSICVTVEPHHNVSNYYLEVDVKKGTGEDAQLMLHAHGINLKINANGKLAFANTTTEIPEETTTVPDTTDEVETTAPVPTTTADTYPDAPTGATVPAPDTNITGATEKATEGKGVDAPHTGAHSRALLWTGIALITICGVVFISRRRKTEE